MRYYAYFQDELPALEYKDSATEAWLQIEARREFEPEHKASTIIVKAVETPKLGDFVPNLSQLLGLMRENMAEKIGNADALEENNDDFGPLQEYLQASLDEFRKSITTDGESLQLRIDGDITVNEWHCSPGQEPQEV